MTRIRYTESNGVLRSRPLVAGERLVNIVIDTINNRYLITSGELNLASGTAVDVAVLKKKAKESAKQLGVVFQDEVRRRESGATT